MNYIELNYEETNSGPDGSKNTRSMSWQAIDNSDL